MSIHNSYAPGVPGLPVFPAPIVSQRDPATSDYKHPIGQEWINGSSSTAWVLVKVAAASATWVNSTTAGAINTITGNSGGAESPSSGNFNILGSGSITVAGSANTETVSLSGLTSHAVLVGAGTATITKLAVGATGTLLAGSTGADPAFTGSPSVSGSLTAATTITATAGDITATLGNVVINGAAHQLQVHGGAATDFIGTGTLVNGVATILNTNIAATDRIFVARSAKNASTAYGGFQIVKNAGVSFVVTACKSDTTTETNDQSSIEYFIVRQV